MIMGQINALDFHPCQLQNGNDRYSEKKNINKNIQKYDGTLLMLTFGLDYSYGGVRNGDYVEQR